MKSTVSVPIPFSPNSGHWSSPGVFTERVTRKDLAYLLLNSADPIIGGVLYEWKVRYLSAGIYELSVRKKEF